METPRDRGHWPGCAARGAVDRGVRFLRRNQGPDGLWRDFDTPAGEASLWPTAFIANVLRAVPGESGTLERAQQALLATQGDDGGWGYNEDVPSDADSTAWALLHLSRTGCGERARRRAVSCLLRHQRPRTGGFATYAEAGPIRQYMGVGRWMPFRGWCRPHTEVTAVAACALAAALPDECGHAIDRAWRFVRSQQRATGEWSSYWWTSPHYTTAQAVQLAAARGERNAIKRAAEWVLRNRTPCGGSVFETALSLSVLVNAHVETAVIGRLVHNLVTSQDEDGGWPSEPILRIPVPAESDPNGEQRWRLVRFAGGIDARDQHRLFTSAACVAALAG